VIRFQATASLSINVASSIGCRLGFFRGSEFDFSIFDNQRVPVVYDIGPDLISMLTYKDDIDTGAQISISFTSMRTLMFAGLVSSDC